jgi:integrase
MPMARRCMRRCAGSPLPCPQSSSLGIRHTKSKRDRVVPLGSALAASLSTWTMKQGIIDGNAYRFPEIAGVLKETMTPRFTRIARKARIVCSSSDPRRTFATSHARRGTSCYVLQRLMGHSNIAATITYYFGIGEDEIMKAGVPE